MDQKYSQLEDRMDDMFVRGRGKARADHMVKKISKIGLEGFTNMLKEFHLNALLISNFARVQSSGYPLDVQF